MIRSFLPITKLLCILSSILILLLITADNEVSSSPLAMMTSRQQRNCVLVSSNTASTTATATTTTTTTRAAEETASAVADAVVDAASGTYSSNGDKEDKTNVVLQLFGYVKDSLVRTVDGTKEMYNNWGRCNEIRAKQKDHREQLKKQWEFEEQGISPKEMKERLAKVNGGITYDEFVFLIKGKEDRSKLMNMMFLMWGAPRFFPYALMVYPDILPSPFAPLPDASGKETKLEKLSRERSHAVLRTLIAIENEAKAVPALSKLNIFGKKKQAERMDQMDSLGKTIGQIMTTTSSSAQEGPSNNNGAQIIMNTMENLLYKKEEFTRAEKRLVDVPKCITTGVMSAISGPNLFQNFMPTFLKRGQVLNHIQKLTEVDNFLVNERVNLDELSTARLLEACNDRMIGGPGRTDEELRKQLAYWLDLSVNQPNTRIEKSGENFNENLARTALMSYFCVKGALDDRCASYLPRLMYEGQQDDEKKNRKR